MIRGNIMRVQNFAKCCVSISAWPPSRGASRIFTMQSSLLMKSEYQYRYSSSSKSYDGDRMKNRIFLPTSVVKNFSVPLTLADVHLRHEQLPFAYVFRATLDRDALVSSLREVLRRYPILGATVDFSPGKVPTLECNVNDSVPMSFGKSELTLDQWLVQKRSGEMQHVGWQSGGGAPTLSPLFDDLFSAKWEGINIKKNDTSRHHDPIDAKKHVATVRITHFKDGGTAVGININHMLGDANSCFRICQVWGRAMRGLNHPLGASNKRAKATLTGMITPDMASLLNLDEKPSGLVLDNESILQVYNVITSNLNTFMGITSGQIIAPESDMNEQCTTSHCRTHEYVRLEFTKELLHAMKSYGMIYCNNLQSKDSDTRKLAVDDFVSTNDMITAMGWLIKRQIAEKNDWNLSMVVNLRSRGGIRDFGCLEDPNLGAGVFGNALTSVVARLPQSSNKDITMAKICRAASAIRGALTKKMANIRYLQASSRSGTPVIASDQGNCFSSTSWMQFPLWDISFSNDIDGQPVCLDGFYGRPSYPLPTGDTYSSINVPSSCGGCTYKMLAPTRQVKSILNMHKNISMQFLDWAREQQYK